MACLTLATPAVGITLTLEASSAGISRVSFGDGGCLQGVSKDNPFLDEAARQLEAYFAGSRKVFDLPLDLRGTAFQRSVWRELLGIPFGQTRTYAEVARAIGSPRAVRAVGAANGANPVPIIVPCHRVVASGGGLGGYGGGVQLKRRLLELELCYNR
ncbi:MAG TPA: methylated-DNA--[protein]-cysteine S-methyltransferase [Bryobacteraceae bacterium]|nr:methylated-DNA--[protein]-cysteine S-methyltransferase [Bryobacteraceae bacterium]